MCRADMAFRCVKVGELAVGIRAPIVAASIVFVELWAIAWIQDRYMETPAPRAMLRVGFGGALVFVAGVLCGARNHEH